MGADPAGDEESIAVPDAMLALRTFPRRYREALMRVPADRRRTRPDPQSWSALEHVAYVRELLELFAIELPMVLDAPGRHFPAADLDGPAARPVSAAIDADAALDGIARASESLATRAESTPWEAWERTFTVGNETHPASWIVQRAASEGGLHLREIERVARLVGGRDEQD